MSLVLAIGFALQLAVAQTPAAPAAEPNGPVAGDWDLTFITPETSSSNTVRVTFKDEAGKVSTTLAVPIGSLELSGTESADGAVKLTGSLTFQGASVPLTLGARQNGDTLTGLLSFGSLGELTFSGKRPPPLESSAVPESPVPHADAMSVAGKWNISLTVPNFGSLSVTAALEQQGRQITGTFNSPLGPLTVSGTLDGASLQLETVAATAQGNITVTMTGQLGSDGLSGKASVAGLGEADWTGVRDK